MRISQIDWVLPSIFQGIWSYFLASHLTTKKNAFNWNPEVEAAFQKLKTTMTTIPVLALPNFS